jgi:hypothetical protein
VDHYPTAVVVAAPVAPVATQPATLVDWLAETLSTLLSSSSGGGS